MTADLRLVPEPASGMADPLVGTTLDGRYLIEKVLGEGGMGLVYKAKHVVLGKSLAIKVLKPEVSQDPQVMERFKREAQSATSIGSPHIIDISDFGALPSGATYFVMEFLDGPSLKAVMEGDRPEGSPGQPMENGRILHVGIQLCDALGAAHERGIVHRDLKPDNIHLVKQGNDPDFVKVLDFGIAKVAGGADKKLTQAGQVFGTPHYMSPEQCSGREVDRRTDIYAVGVMLYEMATGSVPFDADNLMGILTKHVYEQPIPPRELPPPVDVPPGLEAVILKCLAKAPEHRYQTMADLKADLFMVWQGSTPGVIAENLARQAGDPSFASHPGQSYPGQSYPGQSYGSMSGYPTAPSLEVQPGAPGSFEEPAPNRTPMYLGIGFVVLLLLGGGAFAAAFAMNSGTGETGGRVAERTQPAQDPTPPETETETETEPVVETETEPVVETETEPVVEATPIHLDSSPSGAEVLRDDVMIGNTPIDIDRPEEGTIALVLRLRGYRERTINLGADSQDSISLTLDRVARSSRSGRTGGRTDRVRETPAPPPEVTTPPPEDDPCAGELIDPFRCPAGRSR
jgi:serine/threonine protein kinase